MSVALAAPVPAALEPRHAPVLTQLERLDADLARPDLDVAELLDIHDRAVVLGAYCREAGAAFDLWFDASVARLRSERRVGQLLEQIIASSPAWETHADDKRMRVPRGLLKQLGLSGSQSSRWRLIAKLDDFEDRLAAARAARREITTTALVRAARRLSDGPMHGGRTRLSTRTKLRRILGYMREIKHVQSAQESQLLRAILTVSASWQAALDPPTQRPDIVERTSSCLLCGRSRGPGLPARCACGGAWITV